LKESSRVERREIVTYIEVNETNLEVDSTLSFNRISAVLTFRRIQSDLK
jgi:hypothetical protein